MASFDPYFEYYLTFDDYLADTDSVITTTNTTDLSKLSNKLYLQSGKFSGTYASTWQSSELVSKKVNLKCTKCGKELGSFYSKQVVDDCLCGTCHKLEKLKE